MEPRAAHPFEADLDLVGDRSLHRLLDTAVSLEGSSRLRSWLTATAPDPRETIARQSLVRELVPLHLFRDKLTLNALLAADDEHPWQAAELTEWLERQTSEPDLIRWLILLGTLTTLNVALFVANQLALIPALWQITFLVNLGLIWARSSSIGAVWEDAMSLQGALRQQRAVFQQLETFSYRGAPNLRTLCQPFLDPDHRPSRYLARISRFVGGLSLRGNPLVHIILNSVVPWDLYFVYRLDRCKADLARRVPRWMDVWFELEALSSLATYAYLNPDSVFPEIALDDEVGTSPVFRAEGLGHPLIPDEKRVRNDFRVTRLGQVTIVSGSNMAGKSVFLKTIAMNVVLARAGGAVCARFLRTFAFRIFTSMNVSDSVTDGFSFFYAEVTRLKALLTELESDQPLPLLYCIDEIFRGTNNRERLIGGRAYVRALAGKRGVGFVATHDLELTKIADEIPEVKNYHFRDDVVGERMVFDYLLRAGPCPTTNALRIMRLQGLPTPEPTEKTP